MARVTETQLHRNGAEVRLSFLEPLYEASGPFASVYIDASRDAEDAAKAIELRWRASRESLSNQGTDKVTLDAIEEVAGSDDQQPGPQTQVIFAANGEVLLNELLPDRPWSAIARLAPLPHVMPYLAQRSSRVPYTCAVVDSQGADLAAVSVSGVRRDASVEGEDHPLHKPRGGDWNHKQRQRAVEHTMDQNAQDIAGELDHLAIRSDAEVIVLAGEPQMRRMVESHMREGLKKRVVETSAGHRALGVDPEPMDAELVQAIQNKAAEHKNGVIGAFQRERGQHDRAVAGLEETLTALQRTQVEALLWGHDPYTTTEAAPKLWVGADPLQFGRTEQELHDLGVSEPTRERLDAVLVRAVANTGAELLPASDHEEIVTLPESVGALLRFTDANKPG